MASFTPFKAVRPPRDKAHLVSSRSYISYGKKELNSKLSENPFSFIHIINPEYNKRRKSPPNSIERFKAVRDKYDDFVSRGYYLRDDKPAFYLYRQIQSHRSFCGIVGCCSVDDYINGKIKIHEHTLAPREEVFKRYLDTTAFHAEPVLMSHEDNSEVESIKKKYLDQRPEYDFTTTDTLQHQLWLIDSEEDIKVLEKAFATIGELYIADGHHRSASSVGLALDKRNRDADYPKGFDQILSYLIPESELEILPFHRLISDTVNPDIFEVLIKLQDNFNITEVNDKQTPKDNREVLLVAWDKSYMLRLKDEVKPEAPLHSISPDWASEYILSPIFEIGDLRTDSRIDFLGGKYDVQTLRSIIKKRAIPYALYLYPVGISELKAVADAGLSMPPKSTFIEPKLRSGVTIYEMK